MGTEMTDREAFEQAGYSNEWELWQAACKYQREKDAIISASPYYFDKEYKTYIQIPVQEAILNQGDE